LLVFSDALVRSWKQITKFKSSDTSPASAEAVGRRSSDEGRTWLVPPSAPPPLAAEGAGKIEAFNFEGLIRDERGVRFAPEGDD